MTKNGREGSQGRAKRADARRNEEALLGAAADVFVHSGVNAPVRAIAAEAGVGTGTIYRHFPTRSALISAVYRHQVQECAEAGPRLLRESATAQEALRAWMDLFVECLVTKHGLADTLTSDSPGAGDLHAYFLGRLIPVCDRLLQAAAREQELGAVISAYELMRGVGNLCIIGSEEGCYHPRPLVQLLLSGLFAPRVR